MSDAHDTAAGALEPADLLTRNRAWADRRVEEDANYFARLAQGQAPRFLWIGCADSRVPANVITGLEPGEVFVHRNVANVVPHADANALTVLAYAVSVLEVHHVIVCGHYGCGGVAAALDGRSHGFADAWLGHVKAVAATYDGELAAVPPGPARAARLAELNAVEQARNVSRTAIVQDAWARGRRLTVRAWIYDVADGRLQEAGFVAEGREDVEAAYRIGAAGGDAG